MMINVESIKDLEGNDPAVLEVNLLTFAVGD
jgi:hypothetical protein